MSNVNSAKNKIAVFIFYEVCNATELSYLKDNNFKFFYTE